MGQVFLFYLLSTILIISAVAVILAKNTVYSVLFLILTFLNAAGLFLLLGAEFLAMALVIVYVGAIAVLFLFVVMMLDINLEKRHQGKRSYKFIFLGILFIGELGVVCWHWKMPSPESLTLKIPISYSMSNTHAIGQVLYTDYLLIFQLAGVILLIAMIGAIVLTLQDRSRGRYQDPRKQLLRSPAHTLELKKVDSGAGVIL
jgi:NADH-quinone oxidoreductase subunit J